MDWDNPENNDFTGPPIGADIARRQAAIARAEAAFKLPATQVTTARGGAGDGLPLN